MRILLDKFKEIIISIIPVIVIVLILQGILHIVPNGNPVPSVDLFRFLIGSVVLIVGLTVLLFGLDLSISKVASDAGNALIKTRNIGIILTVAGLLGFVVAVAEPDLLIFADQVQTFSGGALNLFLILMSVGFAIGLIMILSFLRAIFKWNLRTILWILYGIIFAITIALEILNKNFFALSYDSSAAVTGAVAVPFILALGTGITRSDKKAKEEDSFGMVGLTAAGTVIGTSVYLLIRSFVIKPDNLDKVTIPPSDLVGVFKPFITELPTYLWQAALALGPFVIFYLILQFALFKESKKEVFSKLKGFLYVFIGLLLFLLSVNVGYIGIGRELGQSVAELGLLPITIAAFAIGAFVILAESSVHVLTDQIYHVTSGSLKKAPVLVALSIGVGLSLVLMVLRTAIPWLTLPMIIIPLYLIALILTFFTPNLFVGLSFDSGTTASGPMAATFILAFIQGVAIHYGGPETTLENFFGTLGMVSVVPIVSIQILGVIYKIKSKKEKAHD